MKQLLRLYLLFCKIGVLTFGGGLAMLPILERELVTSRGWITPEEFTDYVTIGQSTPGIIAVNMATFCGSKRAGAAGGAAATLGVISPSMVIIGIIAAFLNNWAANPIVMHAFAGIRIAVCALIAAAVVSLSKNVLKSAFEVIVAAALLIVLLLLDVPPQVIVAFGAAAGLVFGLILRRRDKKSGTEGGAK
jgi:chromate transporter